MAAVVRHGLIVEFEGRQWAPSNVQNVDGIDFVPICDDLKRLLGISTWGPGRSAFADLALPIRTLRNDACVLLGQNADVCLDGEETATPASLSYKCRRAALKAIPRGQRCVSIKAPSVGTGSVQYESFEMKVLVSTDPVAEVWFEATGKTIAYLAAHFHHHRATRPKRRNSEVAGSSVSWKRDRAAWVAKRLRKGKPQYRTFHPKAGEGGEDEAQIALRAANAWCCDREGESGDDMTHGESSDV